jgi:PAS domain S-box-containing protein
MLAHSTNMPPIHSFIEPSLAYIEENQINQTKDSFAQMVLEIARDAITEEDPGALLQKAADIIQKSNDYGLVQIWALAPNQDRLFQSGRSFHALRDLFVNKTIPSLMAESSQDELASEPAERETSSHSTPIRQRVIIPLCLHDHIFGLISVEDARPNAFSSEHLDAINGAATIINAAFDKFKAIAEARQSYEYLRDILNSTTDLAILATDQRGYIVTSSSGTEAIFELPSQIIIGRDIITLFTDQKFQQELITAINTGESNSIALKNNRLRQATKTETHFLEVSFQRLCCSEQNRIGFLCFVRDVTDSVLYQQKMEAIVRYL